MKLRADVKSYTGWKGSNVWGGTVARGDKKNCKVCDNQAQYAFSMDNRHGKPENLDIFQCSSCGLLFVGNPITDEQVALAYETFPFKDYYEEVATNTQSKVSRAIEDLSPLLQHSSKHRSVLDVGCGYGHFLETFKKQYPSIRITGHELPGNCAVACQQKGFRIFTSRLEDIPDHFSIVVLLDVAEHVPLPNHTFAVCRSLLERDGYIYLHTPRRCFWDSFFLRLMGIPGLHRISKAWFRTRVSIFHLHLWTDDALRLSLQKGGYQLVYMKSEMELTWPLEWYGRVLLGEELHFPLPLIKMITGFAELLFVKLGTLKNKNICLGKKG